MISGVKLISGVIVVARELQQFLSSNNLYDLKIVDGENRVFLEYVWTAF